MRMRRGLLAALLAGLVLAVAAPASALTQPGTAPQFVEENRYGLADGEVLTATWSPRAVPAPWVVTIHGGSWINGTRANCAKAVRAFAAAGWQVFNVEYPRGTDVTIETQLASLRKARTWIVANAGRFQINPMRGSVFGFSAGGHLASLLANSGGFRTVVSVSGVVQPQRIAEDLYLNRPAEPATPEMALLYQREKTMMGCAYVKGTSPCAKRWAAFMPQTTLRTNGPAYYLMAGGSDPVVPHQSSTAFGYWTKRAGSVTSVTIVPGYTHTENLLFDSPTRVRTMLAFVKTHSA